MPEKPPAPVPRRSATSAASWVRSLQCKSMAVEDVAARGAAVPTTTRKLYPLLPRSGCASTGDAARKNVAPSKSKPMSSSDLSRKKSGAKPGSPKQVKKTKAASVPPPPPPPGPLGPLPALTELPAGHSSRQVVEIIFLSSWSPFPPLPPPPPGAPVATTRSAFPGEVEMLFRVHNPARAVARFEDYRAAVRARAAGSSRSAADGNEMMRFSPAPPYYGSDSAAYGRGEDAARVRTFDGSGGAHASARGPSTGRRAMFLCRVIAGRVAEAGTGSDDSSGPGNKEHYDSLRVGKGELVVFDRRAVLPCFLIMYKL